MNTVESQNDILNLAILLDNFYYDLDTYDYRDSVDNREENVNRIYDHLRSGNYSHYLDELQNIIDNQEGTAEDRTSADQLIRKLKYLINYQCNESASKHFQNMSWVKLSDYKWLLTCVNYVSAYQCDLNSLLSKDKIKVALQTHLILPDYTLTQFRFWKGMQNENYLNDQDKMMIERFLIDNQN